MSDNHNSESEIEKAVKRSGQLRSSRTNRTKSKDPARYLITAGQVVVMIMVLIAPWWIGSVNARAQFVLCSLAMLALAIWWFGTCFYQCQQARISLFGSAGRIGSRAGRVPIAPAFQRCCIVDCAEAAGDVYRVRIGAGTRPGNH